MKWFVRFSVATLVLAIPCWLLSKPYQRILAATVEEILLMTGRTVKVFHLQVYAPFDLALFIAMCFASCSVPSSSRRRALLLGIPLLIVLEIVVIALAAMPVVLVRRGPGSLVAPRLMAYAIQTLVWISGPVVWLLFLGAHEFRALSNATTPQTSAPRPTRLQSKPV
jgi:hypothetical protein